MRQRANEVAGAILRLLDDPMSARAMGGRGRAKVASRWSWEDVIARVEAAHATGLGSEKTTTAA